MQNIQQFTTIETLDAATFLASADRQLLLSKPLVIRGLVAHWPLVFAARQSDADLTERLLQYDQSDAFAQPKSYPLLKAAAESGGRFFYQPDWSGLNFKTLHTPLASIFSQIEQQRLSKNPWYLAIQSADIRQRMPSLLADNSLPFAFLQQSPISPKLWLGNQITVATHYDLADNIACCVAGRRRFTLFPPEQLENLYVGPLDFTPAGPPVSLVDVRAPDLIMYPKFEKALACAQQAELAAGDAIFIPRLWWHHVESLDGFNVLINFWWNSLSLSQCSPMDVLFHAMLGIRDLPAEQRQHWQAVFNHYIFNTDAADFAHIPPAVQGVLGPFNAEQKQQIINWLISRLQQTTQESSP